MRYFRNYPAIVALRNTGLPDKAKAAYAATGPHEFQTVNRFSHFDRVSEFFIITHYLELNAAEVRLVLEAALEKAYVYRTFR